MKKKMMKVKKLVLMKETVRALDKNELQEAAGGSAWTCYYSCGSHCPDTISYDVDC